MSSDAKAIKAKVVKLNGPGWLDRYKVKLKLKAPKGVRLSQGETEALLEIQQEDVKVLKDNQQEVLGAIGVTKGIELGTQIKTTQSARSQALATYKHTKDPIKKREWARRLVVADTTRKALTDMKNRMSATADRLHMIKGDIELQIVEAEAKVAETTAYAKAGKQLRLAGETLISARTRAKSNRIEYTNLEVSMEGAEKLIDNSNPDDLLAQADKIAGVK